MINRLFVISLAFSFALSARAQQVELLDFTADSCPACRQMEPVLQDLATTGAPIRRVDVNRERDVAARFGVQYLPTFVAVVDGREVDRQVGATSPDRLREMLDRARIAKVPNGRQETVDKSGETRAERREPGGVRQFPTSDQDSPLSTLDSQLVASSVRLRVEDSQGTSYGTGTIILAQQGEAIVLTCGHLFRESQGKLPVQVELFKPGQRSSVEGQEPEGRNSSSSPLSPVSCIQGEVVGYDLTRDLGLVRIRATQPLQATPLAPRDAALQAGDKAASVGCDHGKEPTVWHTRLTAINRYVGPANVEAAGTPVQGRSGGGLFNTSGELIGVCFAADDQGNEGLYVGLPAIYEELDRLQVTPVATAGAVPSVASAQPLATGGTGGDAQRVGAEFDAAGQLVPVSAPETMVAAASQSLSTDERAALEEIGQRSRGGEVIVIIRPKSPGDRCEIFSLENPSREFVDQLTAIGNKATQPRFTSQRIPPRKDGVQEAEDGRRTSNPRSSSLLQQGRAGATQWTAVPAAQTTVR